MRQLQKTSMQTSNEVLGSGSQTLKKTNLELERELTEMRIKVEELGKTEIQG